VQKRDNSWYKGRALVVPGGDEDKWELLQLYHDAQVAGHPGVEKTLRTLSRDYWWPGMRVFVQAYVRGCLKCQESKARTHLNRPPIQPITPNKNTRLFATIAMDFIVKLPPSQGYDSILMVTDHDCTKVVILLPCQEEMDLLGFAKLYLERIFPFIGLPERVISDRDPRFTSKIFREICVLLKVKQNIASGYHPQTDGQSEKTNQHIETAMRIFGNYQQDSWSRLLLIIQYQLNSRVSSATKQVPYETWMGFIPSAHQPTREGNFPALIERKAQLQATW
jgi:hypothetical protein